MLRYDSPKFEGCSTGNSSGRICSLGKKVRLTAGAVSNFADATSCACTYVCATRGLQMRTYTHTTEVQPESPDAPFQHAVLRLACRCCTMEDLGHPKTVVGIPREFRVSFLWKIMRDESERYGSSSWNVFRKIHRICEWTQRKFDRTNEPSDTWRNSLAGKKWVVREVKIITLSRKRNNIVQPYKRI